MAFNYCNRLEFVNFFFFFLTFSAVIENSAVQYSNDTVLIIVGPAVSAGIPNPTIA